MTASAARKVTLLLVPMIVLTGGCRLAEEASAVKDKAEVCVEALHLSSMVPDYEKLDEQSGELERRAEELRELADSAADRDVAGAIGNIADQYARAQQRKAATVEAFARWVGDTIDNIDHLREVCT
ncbi:hypothetical protein ACWGRK_06295 [Saccharomonospora azurea]|uniref:Uncharacterized protein n=1 Tax=Saccharomonospora azurea NA-128 TaxID=882081 RepID=H8GEP0_9PSEU|nr:hypothetical protein [Saccharomonospora azurea]EHY88985.1 hypothetical protein SacazDRAFT_02073 [Saccharomonospora azurea NA-128]